MLISVVCVDICVMYNDTTKNMYNRGIKRYLN